MGFEPTMTAYETIVMTISLPRDFLGRVSDLNRISLVPHLDAGALPG